MVDRIDWLGKRLKGHHQRKFGLDLTASKPRKMVLINSGWEAALVLLFCKISGIQSYPYELVCSQVRCNHATILSYILKYKILNDQAITAQSAIMGSVVQSSTTATLTLVSMSCGSTIQTGQKFL